MKKSIPITFYIIILLIGYVGQYIDIIDNETSVYILTFVAISSVLLLFTNIPIFNSFLYSNNILLIFYTIQYIVTPPFGDYYVFLFYFILLIYTVFTIYFSNRYSRYILIVTIIVALCTTVIWLFTFAYNSVIYLKVLYEIFTINSITLIFIMRGGFSGGKRRRKRGTINSRKVRKRKKSPKET